ncbi:MAG: hypothetical protein M1834_000841 [Cirrosporium novae-zelandiae]|nr:MAG: hypothetical protein M1834_000841 [Cirrosporium novae-zelandiae]
MAKADVKRDYYADLELKPGVDIAEIKKQFKKLALKYHPDRNPGREAEFNAKFQAIQAAHEILADEQQKGKYDADRRKAGYGYTAHRPATTRAPWPNFPPPPQRSRPQGTAKATYTVPRTGPTATFTSANRYARFAHGETSWQSTKEDVRAKANAKANASAWEQMRHKFNNAPSYRRSPNPSRPDSGSGPEPTKDFPFGVHRSQSSRKKQGYAPATPGAGDEPPARNTSAYFTVHRERPEYYPNPPPRPPSPLRPFRSRGSENDLDDSSGERKSSPYSSVGGEKTYFNSFNLGRSATVRNATKSSRLREDLDADFHSSSARRHSSSPHVRSPRYESTSSGDSSQDEVLHMPRRSKPSKPKNEEHPGLWGEQKTQSKYVSLEHFEASQRMSSSNAFVQEILNARAHAHTELKDIPAAVPDTEYLRLFLQHRRKPQSQDENRQPPRTTNDSSSEPRLGKARSWGEASSQTTNANVRTEPANEPNGGADKPSMYASHDRGQKSSLDYSFKFPYKWSKLWTNQLNSQNENSTTSFLPYWAYPSSILPGGTPPSQKKQNQGNQTADGNPDISFTFPIAEDMFIYKPQHKNLRSHSTENINTQFSPTDFHPKFEGMHGGFPFPRNHERRNRSRGSSSGGRFPRQNSTAEPNPLFTNNFAGEFSSGQQTPSSNIPPKADMPPRKGFSVEEWNERVKQERFFAANPPSLSPTRGANIKRPKSPRKAGGKKPTIPKPATVSIDEATYVPANGDSVDGKSANHNIPSPSGSEMDIDPEIPNVNSSSSTTAQHDIPRHGASSFPNFHSAQSASTPVPPPSTPPLKTPTNRTNSKRENIILEPTSTNKPSVSTGSPSNLDLHNLNNIAPFGRSTTNNEGIKNLSDLGINLPFESRAESLKHKVQPQHLDLPNPPKAPLIPINISQETVERYFKQMSAYMIEWHNFNQTMLNHFAARHQINIESSKTSDWMRAYSDKEYVRYVQGVEEDVRVREHWNISCNKHRECLKKLGEVRARLLGMTGNKGSSNGLR